VVDHHSVFHPLQASGYRHVLEGQRTTLKKACDSGNYLNHPIDNILLPPSLKLVSAYAGDFVRDCANLETARAISDHLPVFARVR
jgi:deoxyribonuclease-1-like protein